MKKPDWSRIRGYWRHHERDILNAGPSDWGVDPYAWDEDIGIQMTPIERALWSDIRSVGVVMYPQWPVAGHFVDFGNPAARVAIECDGRAFHQDKERDEARQRRIEAEGWTVYRIKGHACFDDTEEAEEGGRLIVRESGAVRFIKELAELHGIRYDGRRPINPRARDLSPTEFRSAMEAF